MSDSKVHQALLKARLKFGPVLKNQVNPHFRNRYADLQAVLDAVEGPLADNGLVLVQRTDIGEGGLVLITELVEAASGERIVCRYPLLPAKQNDPQALGGCLTYARRYSALTLLGLAPEDDDGEAASRPVKQQEKKPARQEQRPQQQTQPAKRLARPDETDQGPGEIIADVQLAYLKQELAGGPWKEAKLCERFDVGSLSDLSLEQYRTVLDAIEKHRKEKA